MDRATELVHLGKADKDIEEASQRIERQHDLIVRLRAHGHDLTTANSLLQTMNNTLAVMREHRELILKELAR